MGVALSQTVLARREQFHQSRLVEHLGSWNPFYNDTLTRIQAYLNGRTATGSSTGTSIGDHRPAWFKARSRSSPISTCSWCSA